MSTFMVYIFLLVHMYNIKIYIKIVVHPILSSDPCWSSYKIYHQTWCKFSKAIAPFHTSKKKALCDVFDEKAWCFGDGILHVFPVELKRWKIMLKLWLDVETLTLINFTNILNMQLAPQKNCTKITKKIYGWSAKPKLFHGLYAIMLLLAGVCDSNQHDKVYNEGLWRWGKSSVNLVSLNFGTPFVQPITTGVQGVYPIYDDRCCEPPVLAPCCRKNIKTEQFLTHVI